jgi:hypothetical protein
LLKNSRFEMDLDLCIKYGTPKIESRSSLWHLKSSTRNLVIDYKVVNSVSIGVLFFQLERKVLVSECFGVPFRCCTVHIYIFNKHNSNSR